MRALLATMTIPPTGGAGVPAAPTAGAAPFAVTAPPELTLAPGDRTGSTSFTITNLTGRPVRARLRPRGRMGAPDGWFSVVGLVEVPMGVAATVTATVNVAVPPDAPAGAAQFFLEVVAEDDTESVVGQTVAFAVPAPSTVTPTRKFPWWLIVVGVLVVALVVGGVILFVTRGTSAAAPVNSVSPSVNGAPQVGQPLTANDGAWDPPDGVTFSRQWRSCAANGGACADIPGASEQSYVPVAADAGRTIRVRVTATNAAGSGTEDSDPVGPVEQVNSNLVTVPSFVGLSTAKASSLAQSAGLRTQTVFTGSQCVADVVIENQDPQPEAQVARGSIVRVFLPTRNPRLCPVRR